MLTKIETAEGKKEMQEAIKELKSVYLNSCGTSFFHSSKLSFCKGTQHLFYNSPVIEKPTPPPNLAV